MIKILFICHGNICRSTMAESVMTHLVKQKKTGKRLLHQLCCHQPRGDWQSASLRHSEQIKRGQNTADSAPRSSDDGTGLCGV